MLDEARVEHIVRPLLERAIAPIRLDRVQVTETVDSDGADALDIIAVAPSVSADSVRARSHAAADVQRALQAAGEGRFAFVSFAEPDWLAAAQDDDES